MMIPLTVTRHGETRMRQRGFRDSDLEVIYDYGTDIGHDRIMLTRQDVTERTGELKSMLTRQDAAKNSTIKQQIAQIQRLTDKTMVVSDNSLVTVYHRHPQRQVWLGRNRTRKPGCRPG